MTLKYAKQLFNFYPEFPYLPYTTKVTTRHGKPVKSFGNHAEPILRKDMVHEQYDLVIDALPPQLKDDFIMVSIDSISILTPHSHTIETTLINFYMETDGGVTTYFEGDAKIDNSVSEDSGFGYFAIDPKSIYVVEDFIASENEVWLLDAKQPHSFTLQPVVGDDYEQYIPKRDVRRVVIQIYLASSFEKASRYLS